MKSKIYLFTSPTCPHCPAAKTFMDDYKNSRKDIEYHDVSTYSREGQKLANKWGIMSVPAFIIKGPGYPQNIGLNGVQSKTAMDKYVDISLGLRSVDEPKKGLFDKLRDGIKIGKLRIKI